jgi:hypothetical protein
MPKKSAPYGKCHRCEAAIEIPGLEAFKCSACGWVTRKEPKLTEAKEIKVVSFAPVQPKQLELLGKGGGV